MAAKDKFHSAIRTALEKDGWTITHDPLQVKLGKIEMQYEEFFALDFTQMAIERYELKIIVYAPAQEEVVKWIK